MNTSNTPEKALQEATLTGVRGQVQLMRDGAILPAAEGMALLPGDRIVTDATAHAVVKFTGVAEPLVIEQGSAATLNLQTLDGQDAPQWVAADMQGDGIFFQDPSASAQATGDEGVFGLVGTGLVTGGAFPVIETVAALAGTAAIVADSGNSSDTTTSMSADTSGSGTDTTGGNTGGTDTGGGNTGGGDTSGGGTDMGGTPTAGPLDAVLAPVTDSVDTLLTTLGIPNPIGHSALPTEGLSSLTGALTTA
ncbi:hypothetical protein NQT62_14600 [Limnobacter humi]|uniref:Retention module-containing protein n=1 Tax=Limnobacter humi TaxID=1778671 RepID=A0ABT1WKP9_9BURK|nr:hypothetical protein [Limnobacter humi]MCQ8897668.1 hypothetical protein [Limnobacter humi]